LGSARFSRVGESVNELNGDGAFSDRSGDALDRPVPRISHREHARHAGFEP
jgi:hypothetical protein